MALFLQLPYYASPNSLILPEANYVADFSLQNGY